jgi:hypothetical protein
VWRDTLGEGFIGVRNYSHDMKEYASEDGMLKKWETEFDKVITNNITGFIDHANGQNYAVRSFVYHHGLSKYVQIKKYDDSKKVYLCKIKGEEKAGDIQASIDEVSDQLIVNVRILNP